MQEALYYRILENQAVICDLCPWNCILKPGKTGNCKVRTNHNGKLFTQVYNKVAAIAVDPIEKKPLYHFYPGKKILSIGNVGCNLHCNFCQNHHISQCMAEEFENYRMISAKDLVDNALKIPHNIGIAYTYNEPFTFYEFMFDTARIAHEDSLKNVVVSNGYINPAPLKNLLPIVDAFNIDLKSFNKDFYRKQTKGELHPVLETLKIISKSPAHLEITNLVIPGLNDNETDFLEMVNWIENEIGNETPLHLSRYFPQYKSNQQVTPAETLESLARLAKSILKYVYIGNLPGDKSASTFCPNCGELIILRNQFNISIKQLNPDSTCTNCGNTINIVI